MAYKGYETRFPVRKLNRKKDIKKRRLPYSAKSCWQGTRRGNLSKENITPKCQSGHMSLFSIFILPSSVFWNSNGREQRREHLPHRQRREFGQDGAGP